MKQYRCTRNAPYKHECLGKEDVRSRQGHYFWADSPEEALQQMLQAYPNEAQDGFTIEQWQPPQEDRFFQIFKVIDGEILVG